MSEEKVPLAQRIRDEVDQLLDQKKAHDDAAESINTALLETRRALSWGEEEEPAPKPVKTKTAPAKPVKTAPEPVKSEPAVKGESPEKKVLAILKASKTPMNEAEIGEKLLESKFQTDLAPDDFVEFIYADGVHPLIRKGLVVAVGNPPNRKYKAK